MVFKNLHPNYNRCIIASRSFRFPFFSHFFRTCSCTMLTVIPEMCRRRCLSFPFWGQFSLNKRIGRLPVVKTQINDSEETVLEIKEEKTIRGIQSVCIYRESSSSSYRQQEATKEMETTTNEKSLGHSSRRGMRDSRGVEEKTNPKTRHFAVHSIAAPPLDVT